MTSKCIEVNLPIADVDSTWIALWKFPWSRVRFHTQDGRIHNYLTPMDHYLQKFYSGAVLKADFCYHGEVVILDAQNTQLILRYLPDNFNRCFDIMKVISPP